MDPTRKRAEFEAHAVPHLDALYGAAMRLTRNPRDAEDLVQESMLRAYRFWDTFDVTTNCKSWLLRIVTNTYFNVYQKQKRSRQIAAAAASEQDTRDGVLINAASTQFQDPHAALEERKLAADINQALATLPEDFRVAIVLCDMQGLSYKEIAEIMDCPVGTVMSRLFRGRKLLAHALRGHQNSAGQHTASTAPASTSTTEVSHAAAAASEDTAQAVVDLLSYRKARQGRAV